MGFRKGTGFTNLNKVMTANKGNLLGSTVAGGISQQTQEVGTGVQSAQEQFGEEAQKNRLDTDESRAKRDQTLGKFNQANYTPDESKFKVSDDLTNQYNTQKTDLTTQNTAAQAASDKQAAAIKARYDADAAALAKAKGYKAGRGVLGATSGRAIKNYQAQKGLTASTGALQNLMKMYGAQATGQAGERASNMSGLESYYASLNAAEKAEFMKTEQGKMMAANLPGEQEVKDFAKYRTGTYAGPTELKDISSLYGKAQQSQQSGELTGTSGGRQELLRRFVGSGNQGYSQGERQLDETLLGQDAEQMRGAARDTRGLVDRVSEANQAASGIAGEYAGRAKIFGEDTRKKLDETGKPISESVDAALKAAQDTEAQRATSFKGYQDVISGADPTSAKLDKRSRINQVIQDASSKGYLKPEDVAALVGINGRAGLLDRAAAAGEDITKVISDRLQNNAAQNLSRTGIASDVDVARLNALGRLSGKTGSDLEFADDRAKYQAGGLGLDTKALEEATAQAEAYKAAKDPAYAATVAKQKADRDAALKIATGLGGAALGTYLGGPVGGVVGGYIGTQAGGIAGNVGREAERFVGKVGSGFGAGKTGNWAANDLNTIDSTSGKKVKIGTYANKSSDAIMKQMLNAQQLAKTAATFKGRAEGSMQMNELQKYYAAALKREGRSYSDENLKENVEYSDKDVTSFLNRIKPASYDYKEEVKNSPLASKDRQLGVMAQDLEKSKLGKEAVSDTPSGKIVDYKDLQPKMLASLAALNERLKKIEGK